MAMTTRSGKVLSSPIWPSDVGTDKADGKGSNPIEVFDDDAVEEIDVAPMEAKVIKDPKEVDNLSTQSLPFIPKPSPPFP